MSKTNRTGRGGKQPRHIRLYHWMTNSPAWHDLRALDRAIYTEMAKRYAGDGSNNGRLRYSVREAAAEFRISDATACRSLKSLQDHGFIVAMMKGARFRMAAHRIPLRRDQHDRHEGFHALETGL